MEVSLRGESPAVDVSSGCTGCFVAKLLELAVLARACISVRTVAVHSVDTNCGTISEPISNREVEGNASLFKRDSGPEREDFVFECESVVDEPFDKTLCFGKVNSLEVILAASASRSSQKKKFRLRIKHLSMCMICGKSNFSSLFVGKL
mgnify:CR=1 FL=1